MQLSKKLYTFIGNLPLKYGAKIEDTNLFIRMCNLREVNNPSISHNYTYLPSGVSLNKVYPNNCFPDIVTTIDSKVIKKNGENIIRFCSIGDGYTQCRGHAELLEKGTSLEKIHVTMSRLEDNPQFSDFIISNKEQECKRYIILHEDENVLYSMDKLKKIKENSVINNILFRSINGELYVINNSCVEDLAEDLRRVYQGMSFVEKEKQKEVFTKLKNGIGNIL